MRQKLMFAIKHHNKYLKKRESLCSPAFSLTKSILTKKVFSIREETEKTHWAFSVLGISEKGEMLCLEVPIIWNIL